MNIDLLKTVCVVAIAGSIITTPTVQMIKSGVKVKNSKVFVWVSLFISLTLGTGFAKCFSELSWTYCLWAGFITWLGAEAIYLSLEEKIFKPFSEMKKDTTNKEEVIHISDEDFK